MQSTGLWPNLVIYSMLTTAYAISASLSTQIPGRAESEEADEEMQEDGVRVYSLRNDEPVQTRAVEQ